MDNEAVSQLMQELREYKKFFDDTPVGLLRSDIRTGRIMLANKYCAAMFGYESVDELLKKCRMTDLYGKDDRQVLVNRIRKQGSVQGYEMCLRRSDGSRFWVSANLHINCGGKCMEGSLIDITSQKEAEYELEVFKTRQLSKLSNINEKLDAAIQDYAK